MGSAVAGDTTGAALTTDVTAALSLLKWGFYFITFLFVIFESSWIKPPNVHITMALHGEIGKQFTKLYMVSLS